MSEQEIHEIELNIDRAREFVEIGKACERLRGNADFKKVIQDGYFKEEAIRLVHFKADPRAQKPEIQEQVDHDIRAIGTLGMYFENIERRADMAKESIEQSEFALEEIRNEDDS